MTLSPPGKCSKFPSGFHDPVNGAVARYCRACGEILNYIDDRAVVHRAKDRGYTPTTKKRPKTPGSAADQVLARGDPRECAYCGLELLADVPEGHPQRITIDHIVPFARGGTNNISNLVLSCASCNNAKGDSVLWLIDQMRLLRRRARRRYDAAEQIRRLRQERAKYRDLLDAAGIPWPKKDQTSS